MRPVASLSRSLRRAFLSALAALVAVLALSAQAAAPVDEVDPKIFYPVVLPNYLANFAKYVRWPASSGTEKETLHIGVFSQHVDAPLMAEALRGKRVENRPVEVHFSPDVDTLRTCEMVFLDRPGREEFTRIRQAVGQLPVLIVGYQSATGPGPVGIELVVKDGAVRFHISVGTLSQAGLTPSPELLQLALPPPIMRVKSRPMTPVIPVP